eukprot:2550764-Amphidinium_carterae.1
MMTCIGLNKWLQTQRSRCHIATIFVWTPGVDERIKRKMTVLAMRVCVVQGTTTFSRPLCATFGGKCGAPSALS